MLSISTKSRDGTNVSGHRLSLQGTVTASPAMIKILPNKHFRGAATLCKISPARELPLVRTQIVRWPRRRVHGGCRGNLLTPRKPRFNIMPEGNFSFSQPPAEINPLTVYFRRKIDEIDQTVRTILGFHPQNTKFINIFL